MHLLDAAKLEQRVAGVLGEPVDMRQLAVALLLPLAGGMLGAVSVAREVKGWYRGIRKPSWTPPDWLFGPVWTALYAAMGLASFLVWREGGFARQALPLAAYGAQLALNFAWTPLFFSAHRLGAATADILVLWALLALTIGLFHRVIGAAALGLLAPYWLWVTYAAALTVWIWRHNPPSRADAAAPKPKAA